MTSFAVYQLLEHAVQMPDNEYKIPHFATRANLKITG